MSTVINTFENISIVSFADIPSSGYTGFVARVFEGAAKAGINIDMITQSPGTAESLSFAFTFEDNDMPKLLSIISEMDEYKKNLPLVNVGNVKIVIKSDEMAEGVGFAAKVFDALNSTDCLPLMITTALDEISLLVHECFQSDLESQLKKVLL